MNPDSNPPAPRLTRRAWLRRAQALGVSALLGPVPWALARAMGLLASVERGSPQQLPLYAVAELELDTPTLIEDEPADLAVLTLGGLEIASGILVAADGLLLEGPPLAGRVEPGRYPLQIVLARLGNGDERVALLQLKLGERPAERWVLAEPESAAVQRDGEEEESDSAGFEVESGIACLMDAAALAAWRAELNTSAEALRSLERVLRENRRPKWTWARVRAANAAGVLVSAGFGEGTYAAWWGLDAAGQPVSLVLDFDLIDWAGLPEDPPVEA